MAISTTVFAPSVKAVQPAFIYDIQNSVNPGEVKVYFSLSSYNNKNEVHGLKYTIIDPNVKSNSSNSSSMLLSSAAFAETTDFTAVAGSQKDFYFTIQCAELKELKLNQYYQVQIYLLDQILYEADGITEKDRIYSAPSQATLIRPIERPQLNIDIFQAGIEEVQVDELKNISGLISYPSGSTKEYLAKYKIDIQRIKTTLSYAVQVYSTDWIYNIDGVSFSTKINYLFQEGTTYKIIFNGETVNGYTFTEEKILAVKGLSIDQVWQDFTLLRDENNDLRLVNDLNSGSVKMSISFDLFTGSILVQRAESDTSFKVWSDIVKINVSETDVILQNRGVTIYDYLVKGNHTTYQYRFLKTDKNGIVSIATSNEYRIESFFEDIFLSNVEKQLAIKYNPNISGFKWVVQESITNTLGGRYPLIRRNGDTRYKQFTLSGTLYFDPLSLATGGKDSQNRNMENWIPNTYSNLFINTPEALGGIWEQRVYESKLGLYEPVFKEAAMDFLTDGKPKLFRSATEGYMLVVLTNVSFTPNKQLGRRVVDFSATVTEFAEATKENLMRYGIESEVECTYYVLKATEVVMDPDNEAIVTPYLSEDVIANNEDRPNEYLLKLVERTVRF